MIPEAVSSGPGRGWAGLPSTRIYKLQLWGAFFANYVLYGANYLAIAETVNHGLPTVTNGGVRYFFAGVVTLAWLAARKRSIALTRANLLSTMLCGLLCLGVFGFVALAERHVSSGLAALVVSSTPLVVIALRVAVDRERLSTAVIASVFIGFAGVAIVVIGQGGGTGGSALGMALVMITALGLGTGTFLIPKMPMPGNAMVSGGWQLVWGGLALVIVGCARGEWSHLQLSSVPANAWLSFAYLLTLGTFATFLSFVWLLRQVPVSQVAASGYVNPIVAVVLGWALASEKLTPVSLIGGAVIVVSVAFVIARDRAPVVEVVPPGSGPAGEPVDNPSVGRAPATPLSDDERGI